MTRAALHPTRRRLLQMGAVLAVAPGLARAQSPTPAVPAKPRVVDGYTELRWDDLVPKGWDPMKGLQDKGINNIAMLNDGDPKTIDLMRQMREAWDNAPTEPTLDGSKVRLPGYLVPLEETAAGHTEFLLVPYFGACIHSPPPPANQIVHVKSDTPLKGWRTMDAVWVNGTLKSSRADTAMGASGYLIADPVVERYVPKPRP